MKERKKNIEKHDLFPFAVTKKEKNPCRTRKWMFSGIFKLKLIAQYQTSIVAQKKKKVFHHQRQWNIGWVNRSWRIETHWMVFDTNKCIEWLLLLCYVIIDYYIFLLIFLSFSKWEGGYIHRHHHHERQLYHKYLVNSLILPFASDKNTIHIHLCVRYTYMFSAIDMNN